jgi:hypothetical protein
MNEFRAENLQAFLQFFNLMLNVFFRGRRLVKTVTDVNVHEHLELAGRSGANQCFLIEFYTCVRCGKYGIPSQFF